MISDKNMFACRDILHRKKVITCGKAKYSKPKGARGKVGGATFCDIFKERLFAVFVGV